MLINGTISHVEL